MKNKSFRPAVFVVVYRFNEKDSKPLYLILKRKKHWIGWEFVKGGIDKGESKLQTANREVKEEAGLNPMKNTLRKYNYSGVYYYKKRLQDRPGLIGQTFTLFSAEVGNGTVKFDKKEHSRYKWLSYENAMKIISHRNQKKGLKIVNEWLMNKR